uniref:Uncharacterized protein n=1 Tax=Oryzias latipes TaxID=8090 RepID=A0A3P9LP56_ORYLA
TASPGGTREAGEGRSNVYHINSCFNEPAFIRRHFIELLIVMVASFLLCLHPLMPGYGGHLDPVVLLQAQSLIDLHKLRVTRSSV